MHVLMSCDKYLETNARMNLFMYAKNDIANFDDLSKEEQFISILKSENTSLVQKLAKYVYEIFKTRIEDANAGHDVNISSNINNGSV